MPPTHGSSLRSSQSDAISRYKKQERRREKKRRAHIPSGSENGSSVKGSTTSSSSSHHGTSSSRYGSVASFGTSSRYGNLTLSEAEHDECELITPRCGTSQGFEIQVDGDNKEHNETLDTPRPRQILDVTNNPRFKTETKDNVPAQPHDTTIQAQPFKGFFTEMGTWIHDHFFNMARWLDNNAANHIKSISCLIATGIKDLCAVLSTIWSFLPKRLIVLVLLAAWFLSSVADKLCQVRLVGYSWDFLIPSVYEKVCLSSNNEAYYFRDGISRSDTFVQYDAGFKAHFEFLYDNFAHLQRSAEELSQIEKQGSKEKDVIISDTCLNMYSQAVRDAVSLEEEYRRRLLMLYHDIHRFINKFPDKTAESGFSDRVWGSANSNLRHDAKKNTQQLLGILKASRSIYGALAEKNPSNISQGPLRNLFSNEIDEVCDSFEKEVKAEAETGDKQKVIAANTKIWTLNSDIVLGQITSRSTMLHNERAWLKIQVKILEGNLETLREGRNTLSKDTWEGQLNTIMVDTLKIAAEWKGKVKRALAAE